MYPAIWWGITAVVFFSLEVATASFFFLWIGAGAVLTAVLSFFVPAVWIQYSVFAGSSILLVILSRKWAGRFSGPTRRLANVDSLLGRTAVVTKLLKDHPTQAYVNVDGEMWRAEMTDKAPMVLGQQVVVKHTRSNYLIVENLKG
jgi:membrane protein implicated in regulation of membrane protease activity